MIAKTLLTLLVAFAAGQGYFFIGPNINWWPFSSQPLFPSTEWVLLYTGIFGGAFIIVWAIFFSIHRKGYKDGRMSLTKT